MRRLYEQIRWCDGVDEVFEVFDRRTEEDKGRQSAVTPTVETRHDHQQRGGIGGISPESPYPILFRQDGHSELPNFDLFFASVRTKSDKVCETSCINVNIIPWVYPRDL